MRLFPILALGLIALVVGAPSAVGVHSVSLVAPSAVASGDFADLVDIGGGRRLWLECRGQGSPTVILESGYGNNAQWWDTIALAPDSGETAVLPGVAAFTRVCAYDRPGTILDADHVSRSDPVPMPRTAADVVADLHALMSAAGLPGPYVLVGHSFGGIVVRLFAATYPDEEVVGMVLVDAADEEMHDRLRAALTPEQWATYQQLANGVPPDLADYPDLELVDLDASFAQLRAAAAAHPLPPLPLIVLSRGQTPPTNDPESPEVNPDIPPDFPIDLIEPVWQAGQVELAALVPGARHVIATESGHWIQVEQPQLVTDAVEQVVAAVRNPSGWATTATSPSPMG
jgi:pimeloyl-ACP methyl ester carboxylesterase